MPVVSGHGGADDAVAINRDKKQPWLHRELGGDCDLGAVPRRIIGERLTPKLVDTVEMLGAVGDDLRFHRESMAELGTALNPQSASHPCGALGRPVCGRAPLG